MTTLPYRRFALALAATLAAACADTPPRPDDEAAMPEPARAAVLPIGQTLVFDLDWTVDAGFEEGSPAALPMAGGLRLVGELHVHTVGLREDGTLAAVSLDGLRTRELVINGESIAIDSEMLAGPRAWLVVDPDGGIARAWFPPDAPPLFRHVMGGELGRLDLRGAAAGGQSRVVPTAHGLSEVAYVRDGDTSRRQVQSVARFDAMGGVAATDPNIVGTYDLVVDGDAVPLRMVGDERAVASSEAWTFGAHDRFVAVRVRIDASEPLPVPDLETYLPHDPAAAPDFTEAEQVFAQRMSGELVAGDVGIAITAQDGGLLPSPGFISQATGLLRGWPDEAWSIVPQILSARGHGRQLGFDVLASAGTPQAQQAMCELLARDDVREWEELPLLVGRFAFVRRPTEASMQCVMALYDWARGRGDEALAQAILYPLGSLARHIERDEPLLADLVHEALVSELAAATDVQARVAVIAGLGNHGRATDRDRLLALLSDDDDEIRASAVFALRHLQDPKITDALVVALGDTDRAVAMRALESLDDRLEGAEGSTRLAALANTGAHHPEVALSMANVLGLRLTEDPSVREALTAMAARTDDRRLASHIADLLAT